MPSQPPPEVLDLDEAPPEPTGPLGPLPQFPRSNTPGRPPTPPTTSSPSLETPAPPRPESAEGLATGTYSTASTEPAPEPRTSGLQAPGPAELVDPADIQEAIAQAVDIGFVGVGQLMGLVDRRARGLDHTDDKWVPTVQERSFVAGPAARIAKRHMRLDATALDTVDLLLIGVGVGGFTIRRATGIDPLEGPDDE